MSMMSGGESEEIEMRGQIKSIDYKFICKRNMDGLFML